MTDAGLCTPQIVVLRYRDASTGGHVLRPFATIATSPLSPTDVEKAATDVLTWDRQNHPERFARATILQFNCNGVVTTVGDD